MEGDSDVKPSGNIKGGSSLWYERDGMPLAPATPTMCSVTRDNDLRSQRFVMVADDAGADARAKAKKVRRDEDGVAETTAATDERDTILAEVNIVHLRIGWGLVGVLDGIPGMNEKTASRKETKRGIGRCGGE